MSGPRFTVYIFLVKNEKKIIDLWKTVKSIIQAGDIAQCRVFA
jgi:ribosomal protein S2